MPSSTNSAIFNRELTLNTKQQIRITDSNAPFLVHFLENKFNIMLIVGNNINVIDMDE